MVSVSKFTLAAALSAFVSLVAGQNVFEISQPGPNWWWIANSQNVMTWDCKNSPVQQFTVFIVNSNPNVLSGRLAFIAQQNNADCSKLLDKTVINQAPATGYKLQFTDIINSSKIYSESGEFEIKATGSAFPVSSTGSSGSTATGSGSASASTSTSGSSNKNAASSVKTSMGLGLAAIGAVLGFMTA